MASGQWLICGILTMAMLVPLVGEDLERPDPYSLSVVQFVLKMRSGGRKIVFTPAQKQLYQMGDGVSIALIKILDEKDLTNPKIVKDALSIIVDGFEEPQLISLEMDTKPNATLLLLHHVGQNITDIDVQQEIQKTVSLVQTKASESLTSMPHLRVQQEASSYSVREIQAIIEEPAGFTSRFSKEQLQHIGDRVSIALIKLHSAEDLLNADNLRKYLPMIQDAFNAPSIIVIPEDRQPRVTLFLLHFLQEQVRDKTLEAEIARTEEIVRERTTVK